MSCFSNLNSSTYLTFDCYGTLIDWRKGIETHLGELLRNKGLSANEKIYPTYVAFEAEEEGSYKKYKEILSETAIKVATHFHLSLSEDEANGFAESVPLWKPFEDTARSLRKFGELGMKRVILSNIDRDILQKTISKNNLEVDGFVTAEDTGSYKPNFGHWNSFLTKYKIEKTQMIHVAQSIFHDIIPATKLRIRTAWINRYGEEPPNEITPTFTHRSLEEFALSFE